MRTASSLVLMVLHVLSSVESISGNPLTEEAHHQFNTQHHSQDARGQYKYGYSNAHSAKEESRSLDGITRGSYSYIDANGILQTVSYIADAEHGFKIIPKADHQRRPLSEENTAGQIPIMENASNGRMPDVEPSKVEGSTFKLNEDIPQIRIYPYRPGLNPLTRPLVYPTVLPIDYHSLLSPYHFFNYRPINFVTLPRYNQYHVQNDLGHYSYGYSNQLSSKDETKGSDGVTRGAYSYIDPNGKLQTVSYTADAENGFRVMATNLPLGPVAPQY